MARKKTEFVLAYENKSPNRVKPRLTPPAATEEPKKPKKKPKIKNVCFFMEHNNLFSLNDDTE